MGRSRAPFETWFGAARRGVFRPLYALRGCCALSLLPLALAACVDANSNDDDGEARTSVTIDPLAFLGDLRCSNNPGAIRSYVATLTDESAEGGPARLASSPPIPCSSRVSFIDGITPGHVYTARIDGYEQHAAQLEPRGGEASGSSEMLFDGEPVTPRWTWACPDPDSGSADGDATGFVAVNGINVVAHGCARLDDSGPSAPTAIALDPAIALGSLGCVSDGGAVASFDILPEDGALASVLGLDCQPPTSSPEPAPAVYNSGITPGRAYFFRLEARDEAGAVAFGSRCFATAEEGLTVLAECEPLSATGALEIRPDALLAAGGVGCDGATVSFVVRSQPGAPLLAGPIPCGQRALLSPLPPGTHEVSVEILNNEGQAVISGQCSGEIRPGTTTSATCVPD